MSMEAPSPPDCVREIERCCGSDAQTLDKSWPADNDNDEDEDEHKDEDEEADVRGLTGCLMAGAAASKTTGAKKNKIGG